MFNYLKNLISSTSKESSKRFIAIYISLVLITYVVLRFTNASNIEMILGELIAFVLALVTASTLESIKNKNKKDNEERDTEEPV